MENSKKIVKKQEKNQKKGKKTIISNFKTSYFDFYDDIKTNPKQDW